MFVAGENAAPSAWLVWLQLERLAPARRMKAKVTSAVNRRAPHLGVRGEAGFALDVFIESQYIPRRERRHWRGASNGRLWFLRRAACAGRFGIAVWYAPAVVKAERLPMCARCAGSHAPRKESFWGLFQLLGGAQCGLFVAAKNGTKVIAICKFAVTA